MTSVVVLGAGVVGLSTALRLKETLPSCEVTVVADKFNEETTSHGAAGAVHPDPSPSFSKDISRIHRWYRASCNHYSDLLFSDEAYEAGITLLPFFGFMEKTQTQWDFLDKYVFNLRAISPQTLAQMRLPPTYKSGFVCDTFMLEGRYYLPYLAKKLKEHGATLERRKVESVQELAADFDLIVNCSGLESRRLFNDDRVFPIRGQVMRVHAPWIKHAYMGLDETYIFPTRESVVLGGFRQQDNYNLKLQDNEIDDIINRTNQLVPSIGNPKVIEHWVGLRPGRDQLRLEIDFNACKVPVVHNYGHAGKGMALSYGTAVEAVDLVKQALHRSKL